MKPNMPLNLWTRFPNNIYTGIAMILGVHEPVKETMVYWTRDVHVRGRFSDPSKLGNILVLGFNKSE
tara:strand:+ start:1724 stop:1924 length:201 start_codon:yes stop_codon:yes gene_type:complete